MKSTEKSPKVPTEIHQRRARHATHRAQRRLIFKIFFFDFSCVETDFFLLFKNHKTEKNENDYRPSIQCGR